MQTSAATPPADAPAISPALEAEGGVMLVVPINDVPVVADGLVAVSPALEAAEGGVMLGVPINDVPVVVGGLVASLAGGWGSLTAIGPMLQGRDLSVND